MAHSTVDRLIEQLADLQRRVRHLETADPATPTCLLSMTAAYTKSSNTNYFQLPFNVEIRDRDGLHDSAGLKPRITVQRAGLYLVGGNIQFDSNSTGLRGIAISQNGTEIRRHQHASGDGESLSIATLALAQPDDYFMLMCMQNSGSDLDVLQNDMSPFFWAFKIMGG